MSISENLKKIRAQIPPNVRLIAASKYVGVEEITQAYNHGVRDFAESRLQNALIKISQLKALNNVNWHFIGHLQSNKVKSVLQTFEWIHSVDNLNLIKRIDFIANELKIKPKLLLQVKLAEDKNKFGFSKEDLDVSLAEINSLENVDVRGLMCILPYGLSKAENQQIFETLKKLKEKISEAGFSNITMKELSMGMSSDYLEAINAGATMIRIGRGIFATD